MFKGGSTKKKLKLKQYQKKAVQKLRDKNGVIIIHEVGMGKSLTASDISYKILHSKKYKELNIQKVIVIMPPILKNTGQFETELKNYYIIKDKSFPKYEQKYFFYSYNKFNTTLFEKTFFQDALVIVDEADIMVNAFNKITKDKGKKDPWAWKITWACFHAKRVVLLTATPFRNRLSDLLPYYIILAKPANINLESYYYNSDEMYVITVLHKEFMQSNTEVLEEKTYESVVDKLLPYILYQEHEENEFAKVWYIKEKNGSFCKCPHLIDSKGKLVTIDVEFEEEDLLYDKQKEFNVVVYSKNKSLQIPKRVFDKFPDLLKMYKKHMDSNYIITDTKLQQEFLHSVNIQRQQHISSGVFTKFRNIIDVSNEFPILVYSFFTSAGIEETIKNFRVNPNLKIVPFDSEDYKKKKNKSRVKSFAVIQGSTNTEQRNNIVRAYNKNKIDILIISSVANVGLDLQAPSRQVHILSMDWNAKSIIQTVGRVVRRGIHDELDEKNRNVKVFIYRCLSNGKLLLTNHKDLPNIISTEEKAQLQNKIMNRIRKHFLIGQGDRQLECKTGEDISIKPEM